MRPNRMEQLLDVALNRLEDALPWPELYRASDNRDKTQVTEIILDTLQELQENPEEIIKRTLVVQEYLFKKMKLHCAEQGYTQKIFINAALDEILHNFNDEMHEQIKDNEESTRRGIKRTFEIRASLFRELKLFCAEQNYTQKAVINTAIERLLSNEQDN